MLHYFIKKKIAMNQKSIRLIFKINIRVCWPPQKRIDKLFTKLYPDHKLKNEFSSQLHLLTEQL